MNLSNLKTYVPAVLYKRGLDYFEREYVEQLTEDAPNRWHALVAGTREYDVSVRLTGDGTIISTSCDCPFEPDSLCKHEVAVCLAIREYKEENVSAAVDVLAQLKSLKKAELLEILEDLAERQPIVHLYLTEKLSKSDGMDEQTARRLIRQSVNRASRRGFIEWGRTNQALEGPWEVLEYMDGLQAEQDGEKIIRLSLIVIEECNKMLEMADDSSGGIGSAIYGGLGNIYGGLGNIDDALAQWPEELSVTTVDGMLELLYPHILFGLEHDSTDAAVNLMESVLQWNKKGDFANKFYDFIEKVIGSKEMQNKSYHYDEEQFRMFQLEILRQQGDRNAMGAFFQKHHSFSGVRRAEIREALDAGEFERAIRLCKESEQLNGKLPGLVDGWKKLRFEAYEGMNSIAEMIELSFTFALDGEEEYYHKLRSLVAVEQWPETMTALLREMKTRPRSRSLYLGILIDEERVEELLEYCRSHVYEIENLHPYLLSDYPHEVNELYTSYIYRLVEPASGRKAYRNACAKIKAFQTVLGAEATAGLIEELKFMYPKRRALLDELGKIG